MSHIPVTFDHEGKTYTGTLDKVNGAGDNSMYHLTVDNYHWGQLWKVNGKWRHAHPKLNLDHLVEYFGKMIEPNE